MIRVVLADDQEMVRMGFALMLARHDDVDVVGQCADGVQAIEAIRRLRPDVALLDIRMPKLDGLAVLAQVKDVCAVVMVTTFGHDEYVDEALALGASGFLLKDSGPDLLIAATRAAAAGDALISPELTVALLARQSAAGSRRIDPVIEGLSEREREVVVLLSQGLTNVEIGAELFIALGTVKSHIANVQRELGARNRVEVASHAWRSGLMNP